MAGVAIDSGTGGRKSLDAPVNMVPMIDLLVSIIAFLLMSAVWTQLGAVRAQQTVSSPVDVPANPDPAHVTLTVGPGDVRVARSAIDGATSPASVDRAVWLRDQLRALHAADRTVREVWIQPDTAVDFQRLVEVMDVVYGVWSEGAPAGRGLTDSVAIRML